MKIRNIVGIIVSFGLGLSVNTIVNKTEASNNKQEKDVSYQVIETEKVKVEYWDIDNGDFDILVTTKNEYNISPEFSLDETKYYQDGYLIGKTESNAKKLFNNSKEKYPSIVTWEFDWNN